MALKSTIFKADLIISDIDRHYYAEHPLAVALRKTIAVFEKAVARPAR